MRVYLPATLTDVQRLLQEDQWMPLGGTGFALTPALREAYVAGDDEELAEVALRDAARASLRLLAAEETELPVRRVVVVAERSDAQARPDLDTAVVRISDPAVTTQDIAAVHVDLEGAAELVEAAVEAVDRADLGDEDAELTVGDALDVDLAWYDAVELPFLLTLL